MNAHEVKRRREGQDGIALLIALLFVVLLTVLIVEFVYETQVEATHTAGHQKRAEALITAESAVAMAMSMLEGDLYQSLGVDQGSGQQTGGFGLGYDGYDEYWAYGVPFQERGETIMQCSIADEFGKLNINALFNAQTGQEHPILIEALRILFEIRSPGIDPTDAILDWIDPDEAPREGGVESEYYQSLAVPYASKNGPMDSIEELLLIPGITPEVYFGDPTQDQLPLSDLLTVHGDAFGDVNLNTAQWELLDALGVAIGQTGFADLVIEEREQQPFLNEDDYVARGILPADPPLMDSPMTGNGIDSGGIDSDGDGGGAGQLPQNFLPIERTVPAAVGSKCFRLRGHGIAGGTKVRIDAYVWRDPDGVDGLLRVLDWRVLQ